ncbi:MAG: ABC transporter permease [Propionibacteriaceae bacterium]|jgi:putative ABC transport system permease protein|nr:ABC transporter permease [Propionibacteriaceae bacterium]
MARSFFFTQLRAAVFRRRSRAIAAALAVAVGTTTLTALTSVALDLHDQLARQLRAYGANLVVTAEAGRLDAAQVAAADTALADAELVGQAVYRYENAQLNWQPVELLATDVTAALSVRPYWDISGELPGANEVLLGRDVAELTDTGVGDEITLLPLDSTALTGVPVRVAGILVSGGAEDAQIVANPATAVELFGQPDAVDLIEYSVVGDPQPLARALQQQGVQAAVVKRLEGSQAQVQQALGALLWLVAALVLTLMLLCVATTTLALVAQRQGEIALRKALGASDQAVRREILAESVTLGVLGGVVGAGLGLGLAALANQQVFGHPLAPQWLLLPAALVVAAGVTAVAAWPPVQRARRVNPAIVLSGE